MSLAFLTADVIFVEGKLGYKFAFKSTGELAAMLKLAKLRKFIGSKGYALILSIIHWRIRDLVGETWKMFEEFLHSGGILDLRSQISKK